MSSHAIEMYKKEYIFLICTIVIKLCLKIILEQKDIDIVAQK